MLGSKIKPTKGDYKEFDLIINEAFQMLNNQLEGFEYLCQDMSLADIQV